MVQGPGGPSHDKGGPRTLRRRGRGVHRIEKSNRYEVILVVLTVISRMLRDKGTLLPVTGKNEHGWYHV